MKYQPPSFCIQKVKAGKETPCSLHTLLLLAGSPPWGSTPHPLWFLQLLPDPHLASVTPVLVADLALWWRALASPAGYPCCQCYRWKGMERLLWIVACPQGLQSGVQVPSCAHLLHLTSIILLNCLPCGFLSPLLDQEQNALHNSLTMSHKWVRLSRHNKSLI